MKLKKISGQFDSYSAELSFAELTALQSACAQAGEPIADSMAQAVDWYLAHELPGPGEEKTKAGQKTASPNDGDVETHDAGDADVKIDADADEILPDAEGAPAPSSRFPRRSSRSPESDVV